MLRVPYQEFLEKVELGKVAEQRILSAYIFDKIVPARTIPVRLGTKEAIDPLWSVGKDSVAIRSEMDGFPAHHTNYGFTYSAGLLDVDIDSDDPSYNRLPTFTRQSVFWSLPSQCLKVRDVNKIMSNCQRTIG
jgi:hypothetical protein